MSEATFTFRVDESLKSQFTTAAKDRDRTGAQLLRDFMRDFSANAGKLTPAAEVEAKFAAKRAATRRRLEGSGE